MPLSDRKVRFVPGEVFSGLLVPIVWRSLDTQTREGFEEMNRALKLRAEHYSRSTFHLEEVGEL